MKNYLCMIALAAGLAGAAGAQESPADIFRQANDAYARNDYRRAAQCYESLRAAGHSSADLYYDLGNAYFRDQQIGRAALNYERAYRLAPRDSDIRHNLRYVRSLVKEPAPSFVEAVITGLRGLLSLNELLAGVSLLFITGLLLLSVYVLRGSTLALAGCVAAVAGLIVCGGWLLVALHDEKGTRWAVTVAGSDARNGPGTDNSVAFTLPEGRRVILLGDDGDWYAVGLPQEGIKGWMEKRAVEPVDVP